MRPIRIALIGGDGIGPEVIRQARRVLETLADRGLARLSFREFPHGADHFLATGETLSDETFATLRDEFDAILFGAVGDPRIPDGRHARDLLLGLRFRLDLFLNRRPARLRLPALSPLRRADEVTIDFSVYRENTEGSYGGRGRLEAEGTADEVAVSEGVASRRAVERIVRVAFEDARAAGVRVTLADKANAVPHMYGLWRRVFGEVAATFPDVESEMRYVDALAMEMVRAPERFGIIVTENLLGDILSDLAAELIGGPGLAPSANVHPGRHGLYEPVHGSAPDIAGSGRANPIAAILSAAMLLEDHGAREAAAAIEAAVDATLATGLVTPDLGGTASTSEVGDRVCALVAEAAAAP
ncbi:MAG: isocitrate/isopropylmalate dehydrogenase family protein [Gemmatimonadota bacterium]|nr:isocitrate/isopropylmalate dehydrogenase family protein [Gemmatimonadota bacterium]